MVFTGRSISLRRYADTNQIREKGCERTSHPLYMSLTLLYQSGPAEPDISGDFIFVFDSSTCRKTSRTRVLTDSSSNRSLLSLCDYRRNISSNLPFAKTPKLGQG